MPSLFPAAAPEDALTVGLRLALAAATKRAAEAFLLFREAVRREPKAEARWREVFTDDEPASCREDYVALRAIALTSAATRYAFIALERAAGEVFAATQALGAIAADAEAAGDWPGLLPAALADRSAAQ
jgi:hypothetical protein